MYFDIDDFDALRCALKEMCAALSRELDAEKVFDLRLVADELLSNVLQHGGGRAQFVVEKRDDEVRLCVKDPNGYRPPERSECADAEAECGRGLFLVDEYADRRDYSEREGIRVYFKLG